MFMKVLPKNIYVYHMCAWCLQRSEEALKSSGTGTNNYKLPQGFGNQTLLFVQAAQHVLTPEPFPQSPVLLNFKFLESLSWNQFTTQ